MQKNLADLPDHSRAWFDWDVSDLQGHDFCWHGTVSLLITLTRQAQMLAGYMI